MTTLERTTKHYYESHVTIDPVFGARRALLADIARNYEFRIAPLFMRKSQADIEGQPHNDDAFMTGHSVNDKDITDRTSELVHALRTHNFAVRRYKIEETMCDSRTEDTLELMRPCN